MSNRPHDGAFRRCFSKPENAAGLLQHVLRAPLVAALDWSTLRREPDSFIHDESMNARYADVLFSIVWCDEPDTRLFALVEHLSNANEDTLVPTRIIDYHVHIGNEIPKNLRQTDADRPPAIVSVVVYHGERPWKASTAYAENLDIPSNKQELLAGLVPNFRYRLADLNVTTSEALRTRAMTAYARMTLWFLKLGRQGEALLEELDAWAGVEQELRRRWPDGKAFRSLWRYYLRVSQMPVKKVRKAVEAAWGKKAEEDVMTTAELLEKRGRKLGKAEGRAEGKTEGKAEAVVAVLEARGLPVPRKLRERILSCKDIALLDRWLARVASAASAAEVVGE